MAELQYPNYSGLKFDVNLVKGVRAMNDPFSKEWKADEPTMISGGGTGDQTVTFDQPITSQNVLGRDGPDKIIRVTADGGPLEYCTASSEPEITGPEKANEVPVTGGWGTIGVPWLGSPTISLKDFRVKDAPQQKRVDPMWDRYFEMAFQQLMAAYGLGVDTSKMTEAVGKIADEMLAEREKRAK